MRCALSSQVVQSDHMEKKESKMMRWISALVTVLLILAVMLCVYVVFQLLSDGYANVGGFMMFRVVTGSMEPTISIGTLMVTQEVDISTIRVGDIVCFRTYDSQIYGSIVTHRVVNILQESAGILLETKGDANIVADGYYVSRENFVGKVIWYTGDGSVLASIFGFFTNKVGFLGCIVFPCLLLAGFILQGSVKSIRQELEQARQELNNPTPSNSEPADPLASMTQEEYAEMMERIRSELTRELIQQPRAPEGEHHVENCEEESHTTE